MCTRLSVSSCERRHQHRAQVIPPHATAKTLEESPILATATRWWSHFQSSVDDAHLIAYWHRETLLHRMAAIGPRPASLRQTSPRVSNAGPNIAQETQAHGLTRNLISAFMMSM